MKLLIGVACLLSAPAVVHAQTRAETLRQVTGNNINTLDPTMPGATREAFGVSTSTYDRLVAFDRKREAGVWVFDRSKIRGELAESYEISPDGLKITFKLRDAKWHDGTPISADDVTRRIKSVRCWCPARKALQGRRNGKRPCRRRTWPHLPLARQL